MKEFYRLSELMERWQISRATLWRIINRGELKTNKISGKSVRVSATELIRYEADTRELKKD
jgi:predicted DNA-binding transcriptional regulator AlpA